MIIFANVSKLYDGKSAARTSIHERVDLLIENGRIDAMRPHDPQRALAPATVVDGSGLTIAPGLIDCHGHVTLLGLADGDSARTTGLASLLYVEKILHRTLVEGGVTTMRDVGGATHFMKRMVDEGVMIGPRLKISICMLSTTGGHADFRGPDRCHGEMAKLWGPEPGRPSSLVDGPWECRKRVREIAACGADLIKICTSPGVASPSDRLEHQDFTAEEIEAIATEAAARGLKVAAHAHSKNGISLAIDHGVSDIQHISFMDERLVERAHAKGLTVTPTSWVIQLLPRAEGLSPFVMEKVKKVAEVHARAVQHAASGGLKILGGTDPVLPGMHGRNYMELDALVKDGLAPLAAWHGMTGLAAAEIGQDDAGTIAPGKRADLLVCRGDVLDTPRLLDEGALVEVLKDGVGHRGALGNIPQRTFRHTTHDIWTTKLRDA
ncbi:MAG: amidohydrolase family protein [Acidobacteriota bacterium]